MIQDSDIKETIIEKVKIIASQYYRPTNMIGFDEYIDAGMKGVFMAMKRYNPDKKCRFMNYVDHRIRGEIRDMIRKRSAIERYTVSMDELETSESGYHGFGQTGINQLIFSIVGKDEEATVELLMDINKTLEKMNGEFRELLVLYYLKGFRMQEIGRLMGISWAWVFAKKKTAMRWFKFYWSMT